MAAVNGNAQGVKLLLKHGADPNAKDEFTTAFKMANALNLHSIEGKYSDNLLNVY